MPEHIRHLYNLTSLLVKFELNETKRIKGGRDKEKREGKGNYHKVKGIANGPQG